jgi:hypothetical protein
VGKKSFAAIGAVVLALTAVAAPLVQADEVTRESYKEAVEPICKANTKANERILKGARAKVKHGKLKQASGQFFRAATALRKTVKELEAVPQPTADEAKLTKWLKTVGEEANLFQKTGKKLKAGNKNGALAMVIRLEHNANVANNQVLGFEFHYCRFEPSKFT